MPKVAKKFDTYISTKKIPDSPEGTGVTIKNIEHIRLQWDYELEDTTKVDIHRFRNQTDYEKYHNNKVSQGVRKKNGLYEIGQQVRKKRNEIINDAILNLDNKRLSLKNGKNLTETERSEYRSFVEEQWKRTESIEKLKSYLRHGPPNYGNGWGVSSTRLDLWKNTATIFNATRLDDNPISAIEKSNIGVIINKWINNKKDDRRPIKDDKESWDRMKLYFEEAEVVLNVTRQQPAYILKNNRNMEAFNPFYVPPFLNQLIKKEDIDIDKKTTTWIKARENEMNFLTKTAKELYKEIGRTPPRESWEDKIIFRNKLEIIIACICTGNTT